ncbi:butyrophilin subfamily 1 member A1-like [Engraulis encrasicolus]|uniref:butyrophilin subfamily 1 member A1-like n=1 Tax=Engraulis encrasicolus TaxID=184585 RepID=UPI002FD79DC0
MPAVWAGLLLFVAFRGASSAGFSVLAPERSLSAWIGSSITLRCTVSPDISVTNMEVRWYCPEDPQVPVLQRTSPDSQVIGPQYRGRVSLAGDLGKGDVSLKMENLKVADRGEYVCYVKSTDWYDTSTVTLQVTATGSAPLLSTAVAGEGQVNVTCASEGWSPAPKLTWTDRAGQSLPGNPTTLAGAARGTAAFISTLLLLMLLLLGAFVLYKKGNASGLFTALFMWPQHNT